jgi:hypothetical protein
VSDSCTSFILSSRALDKDLFSTFWVFKIDVSFSWFHASSSVWVEANIASCCAVSASTILVNEFSSVAG